MENDLTSGTEFVLFKMIGRFCSLGTNLGTDADLLIFSL